MESDPVSKLLKKHRGELYKSAPSGLDREILGKVLRLSDNEEKSRIMPWLSLGGGAVTAVIALLLTFQLGRMSSHEAQPRNVIAEVVSSHVRSLMAQHLSDVISTDQHTVKPWFEGKIDFGPSVKDFAQDGFPLIGGRLDYIDGRSAAALIYKSNKHVINVFQYPATGPGEDSPQLSTVRGYQVYAWTKDGMNFWAVSDLNSTELRRFVGLWEK